MSNTFQDLGIQDSILDALAKRGFEQPTAIQSLVIPRLLGSDSDLVARARTGTGKTAAFGIPILQRCERGGKNPAALILTPTRELAVQVGNELQTYMGKSKLRVAVAYGGQGMASQIQALKSGVDIVVGTPGRIRDHIERGRLVLSDLRFLVLDEADRMLDMGFQEELDAIVNASAPDRNTWMFSATYDKSIRKAASKYTRDHEFLSAAEEQVESKTRTLAYEVNARDKVEALKRVLHTCENLYGLIFCARKSDVDNLAASLQKAGFQAEGLHGDMNQPAREKVLGRLRKKKISLLVATDVAARGIDINDLGNVINFDMPDSPDALVHRTGRTSRAGKTGTAICLITPSEFSRFRGLEKTTGIMHEREPLPSREAVLAARKQDALHHLSRSLERTANAEYDELTDELLETHDAKKIISILLKDRLGDALIAQNLPEIIPPAKREKSSGKPAFRQRNNAKKSGRRKKYEGRTAEGSRSRSR
jgi:ATP-dependent RNA helicase DeaD